MSSSIKTIEKFLNNFAKSLEISNTAQQKATDRYESIGNWLNRKESLLAEHKPEFYSQGSIRLGTAIKPLKEDDEYDLDAVCLLNKRNVNNVSQEDIKNLIGYELGLYVEANNFQKPLDEGKRCWTLEYSDSAQFHMDILPSVPDEEGFRKQILENANVSLASIDKLHTATAISITDNTSYNYKVISPDWNKSNPKGYHEWFKEKCRVTQVIKNSRAFESATASVEEIPSQTIKKPLQKAIMILKRHRDIMFQDNPEHKPISIIITTLSAKAYKGTEKLKDTLDDLVYGMINQITCDTNKNCIVLNPVNPNENFADKWKDESIKRDNFFKWIEQLKIDYNNLSSNEYNNTKSVLESRFGKKSIEEAYNDSFGLTRNLAIKAKELLSLTHVKQPTWIMNTQYPVSIVCQKSKDGMLHQELKNGEPIEKNWHLRFEAKIQNIGSGRKFYWQVANSGIEATNANCLRGEFYDGEISKGGKVREEDTSYTGSHFVRCFIVQNNQCVAVSEPFIVNII